MTRKNKKGVQVLFVVQCRHFWMQEVPWTVDGGCHCVSEHGNRQAELVIDRSVSDIRSRIAGRTGSANTWAYPDLSELVTIRLKIVLKLLITKGGNPEHRNYRKPLCLSCWFLYVMNQSRSVLAALTMMMMMIIIVSINMGDTDHILSLKL